LAFVVEALEVDCNLKVGMFSNETVRCSTCWGIADVVGRSVVLDEAERQNVKLQRWALPTG
jgi:hypothetical protein